jgi:hypothetical protein
MVSGMRGGEDVHPQMVRMTLMKKSVPIPNLTATAADERQRDTRWMEGGPTERRDEEPEEPDQEEEPMVFLRLEVDLLRDAARQGHRLAFGVAVDGSGKGGINVSEGDVML